MKKGLIITGGIILIIGLLQLNGIAYRELNEFETGYLAGSVLLAIIGIALIITGGKINRKKQ
jgi:predicted tellurium resistance membrane protein TerC